jgi:CBS domain-containing protein
MELRNVKQLMVPVDRYAVVPLDATLIDAIMAMEEAQKRADPDLQPFRAVLVEDEHNAIVGKIGQIAFLRALQPQRKMLDDSGELASAGVSEQVISVLMDHYKFFQDNLSDMCARASAEPVKNVMRPISQSIDEDSTLAEAISRIVQYESLSIPVKSGNKVVGLLRLSDVYGEIANYMKSISGY